MLILEIDISSYSNRRQIPRHRLTTPGKREKKVGGLIFVTFFLKIASGKNARISKEIFGFKMGIAL